jgi:hypothetical protein
MEKKYGFLMVKHNEWKLIQYNNDEIGVLYEIVSRRCLSPNTVFLKKIEIKYPNLD